MHRTAARLTPREREIAALIGRGMTNRQIGLELSISERTVGAHVQNMLNKLTASNRAQLALLAAAEQPTPTGPIQTVPAEQPTATRPIQTMPAVQTPNRRSALVVSLGALLVALAVVVAATDDGWLAVTPPKTSASPVPPEPLLPGTLIFEAQLAGDGAGFQPRYIIGDPNASAVRFTKGAVEYTIVQPGGNTGNGPDIPPMKRYYTDVTLQVTPGSGINFWLHLDVDGPRHPGSHEVAIDTWKAQLQLIYLVQDHNPVPLTDLVRVDGLESGRMFRLSALVDPPHYVVFIDGARVIDITHTPGASLQSPAFGVFGDDTGSVRITSVRIYAPT